MGGGGVGEGWGYLDERCVFDTIKSMYNYKQMRNLT